jgi:hypothetical protein
MVALAVKCYWFANIKERFYTSFSESSITEKWRFITQIKLVISCHKQNLKPILTDYIYLNFGKKAKGQTLLAIQRISLID